MIKKLKQLGKYWHGDIHPRDYKLTEGHRAYGIGILFEKAEREGNLNALASFNIVLQRHPDMLKGDKEMLAAVADFSVVREYAAKPYLGGTVGEYACLVSPETLKRFLAKNTKASK